jgi:hypothetical protein
MPHNAVRIQPRVKLVFMFLAFQTFIGMTYRTRPARYNRHNRHKLYRPHDPNPCDELLKMSLI